VDVARALGVSHGSVYRHFRTKAALREAVTQRWLERTVTSLGGVAAGPGEPERRLRRWLTELFAAKRRLVGDDPELFATYMVLVGESSTVVDRHRAALVGQLAAIIREGAQQGAFAVFADTEATARAVFDATDRYHHPAHSQDFTALLNLLVRALRR
jgi:AcrR family transcriptional regulator